MAHVTGDAESIQSRLIEDLTVGRYPSDALVAGETFDRVAFTSVAIDPADGAEVTLRDCTFGLDDWSHNHQTR